MWIRHPGRRDFYTTNVINLTTSLSDVVLTDVTNGCLGAVPRDSWIATGRGKQIQGSVFQYTRGNSVLHSFSEAGLEIIQIAGRIK